MLPDRLYFAGRWHYESDDPLAIIGNAIVRAGEDIDRYARSAPHPLTMTTRALLDALAALATLRREASASTEAYRCCDFCLSDDKSVASFAYEDGMACCAECYRGMELGYELDALRKAASELEAGNDRAAKHIIHDVLTTLRERAVEGFSPSGATKDDSEGRGSLAGDKTP